MCHSDSSRPPLPPISGAAADQGDFVLTSADGTEFAAYFARASKPTGAGMVVMPDVRGLHTFYHELAVRVAETGNDAMAIDFLGRAAGADGATPPELADDFVQKLTEAGVPHERHVYAGAPHSFFDRSYEQWKDACDDAWRRILDFVKKHS